MRKIKLKVTQDNIDKACYGGEQCMVALALNEHFNQRWWVGRNGAASESHAINFPNEVIGKIRQFDMGLKVAPFECDLTVYRIVS